MIQRTTTLVALVLASSGCSSDMLSAQAKDQGGVGCGYGVQTYLAQVEPGSLTRNAAIDLQFRWETSGLVEVPRVLLRTQEPTLEVELALSRLPDGVFGYAGAYLNPLGAGVSAGEVSVLFTGEDECRKEVRAFTTLGLE